MEGQEFENEDFVLAFDMARGLGSEHYLSQFLLRTLPDLPRDPAVRKAKAHVRSLKSSGLNRANCERALPSLVLAAQKSDDPEIHVWLGTCQAHVKPFLGHPDFTPTPKED